MDLATWQATFKQRDIIKMMIDTLDERIDRLTVALKVNKHSKRKKKMKQLLYLFIQFKLEQMDRLNVIDEGSNARKE